MATGFIVQATGSFEQALVLGASIALPETANCSGRLSTASYSRNNASVANVRTLCLLASSIKAKLAPERLRKAEARMLVSTVTLNTPHCDTSHRISQMRSLARHRHMNGEQVLATR
jgi:hypothetical protein